MAKIEKTATPFTYDEEQVRETYSLLIALVNGRPLGVITGAIETLLANLLTPICDTKEEAISYAGQMNINMIAYLDEHWDKLKEEDAKARKRVETAIINKIAPKLNS